jgi:hypothetical protein
VFCYVAEDEVGGDGRHLVEAGFAELAFHVAISSEAEAAVGLAEGALRVEAIQDVATAAAAKALGPSDERERGRAAAGDAREPGPYGAECQS